MYKGLCLILFMSHGKVSCLRDNVLFFCVLWKGLNFKGEYFCVSHGTVWSKRDLPASAQTARSNAPPQFSRIL